MTNFAAPPQPAFGRRGQPRSPPPPRGGPVAPDMAAAQSALSQGKAPAWARQPAQSLIAALLLVLALLAAQVAFYGPDLARDLALAGSWEPAPDLRAEDGKCTNYQFVWTLCSAVVVSPSPEGETRRTTNFMMTFTRGGGEALIPMRSTRDPNALAIGYAAQDELANRTISFVVYALVWLAAAASVARKLARGQYRGGRAHRALAAGLAQIAASAS